MDLITVLRRLASMRLILEFGHDYKGLFVTTIGGRRVYVFNPVASRDMFDLEDIAHALGMLVRWCGHVKEFYSVAQHSVYTYRLAQRFCEPVDLPIVGPISLLHDGTEFVMTDLATPVKVAFKRYPVHERRLLLAMLETFGIPWSYEAWDVMKVYDRMLLHAESATLKNKPIQCVDADGTLFKPDPLRPTLTELFPDYRPWSPEEAKEQFLIAAKECGLT